METIEAIQEITGNEKDTPCVSIMAPLSKTLPDRNQNKLRIKNTVHQAKAQLSQHYDKREVADLLKAIDQLHGQVDLSQHAEGVGLFVSRQLRKLLYFSFPVEEKVIIDERFDIRELILNAFQQLEYWVLCLSNNHTRLLRGKGKTLEEIQDEHFPIQYEEQFEYPGRQKPRMVGSVVYGTEESLLKEERQREYFRHVDKRLAHYVTNNSQPLFVVGVSWYQPLFQQVTHHGKNIVSFIEGNYDHLSAEGMTQQVWPAVEAYEQQEKKKILSDITEKIGQKRGYICGIETVWPAAQQGRGAMLVVEKDFVQPAFYDPASGMIRIEETEGGARVNDAVVEIIEAVFSHRGKVILLDHGQLENYQHIALLTRY